MYPPPFDRNIRWINAGDSKIGAGRRFPTQYWKNHAEMAKYTIATLQAMVGVKPTDPIDNIHKRPNLSTIWHPQCHILYGLRKVGNFNFPLDGQAGYILSKEAFTFFSSKERRYPGEVGEYYEIPTTPITETEQQTEENKRKFKKLNRETFKNLKMVTTKLFEEFFNPDFHYDSRGLATKGFGTTPPVDILANLQRLYGKLSYKELDAALLHLKNPINLM